MKKLLTGLLILALMLPFCGCSEKKSEIQVPVTFYYRRTEVSFEGDTGVISPEIREAQGHENDLSYLLNLYLSGPSDTATHAAFPQGTKLISLTVNDEQTSILISNSIADLKGMDLTIACACITMTVMELTGTKSVEIKADRAQLNDADSIIMDQESLLLLEDSAIDSAD